MKKRLIPEEIRIQENHLGSVSIWDKWGPYLSERLWGTVREDYSETGDAWRYFPHDMARSRAYRWGEDGIGGISDRYQIACFSLALWNHQDPILKERLFGLNPYEGNHGEDVKELYYYLDNCPSHAYMKYLYKYPQKEFPYEKLVVENQSRTKLDQEYELIDTGIFNDNDYFDVFIEYAKVDPEDICIRIEVINRGNKDAVVDIIPQIWFRNLWSFRQLKKPVLSEGKSGDNYSSIHLNDHDIEPFPMLDVDYKLGKRFLYGESGAKLLFTENETNFERFGWRKNDSPYVKDAFHRYIIHQEKEAINPLKRGTKAAFHYADCLIKAGESKVVRLRLSELELLDPLANVDAFCQKRKMESDAFYELIANPHASPEEKNIQKAALSSQLWSRQLYLFIVNYWLTGDNPNLPLSKEREKIRNEHWRHLVSKHVITMPDKWEYPWFAAWDMAFHTTTIALYDLELAKDQLWLLLTEQFQHPNGQIPAYEWEFSDLNPPVQGWALLKIYRMEEKKRGKGDINFLKKCFQKLVINFVWWVNREDASGNNVFEGGFLGLDNITVIDRSKPLPNGGEIEQSDGTGWMGMFCLNLMRIAIEISREDPDYEPMITKFFQHFVYISNALTRSKTRDVQNWSEEDGFFYDVLKCPDGSHKQIPVRSLVGIIPIYSVDWIEESELRHFKDFYERFTWFIENKADLLENCVTEVEKEGKKYYLFSLITPDKIKRVLARIWDKDEFRSRYGIRSLSKYHEDHPFSLFGNSIHYAPGESLINMYGGNSNWRGPIWFPTNYLLIETLKNLHEILGPDFKVKAKGEMPVTLKHMADALTDSLINLFKEEEGKKPIYGDCLQLQKEHFKDYFLFYEHFHGDTGRGLGASHQTGWTALIANLIDEKTN